MKAETWSRELARKKIENAGASRFTLRLVSDDASQENSETAIEVSLGLLVYRFAEFVCQVHAHIHVL